MRTQEDIQAEMSDSLRQIKNILCFFVGAIVTYVIFH